MSVYCLQKVKHAVDNSRLVVGATYIYLVATQAIIREVALFLYDEYFLKLSSVLTQVNVANAIWQWLEFNAAARLNWKEADVQLLLDYRDLMLTTLSLRTGRPYARGTVATRMIAVIMLYRYLKDRNILVSDIADMQDDKIYDGCSSFANSRVGRKGHSKKRGYIPVDDGRMRIAPFSRKNLQSFLNVIGPRASLKDTSDGRRARDRLIVDLGWAVGLRNFEITGLRASQFSDLQPEKDFPGDHQRVEILGKRSKRRVVAVPNWLVLDAQAYINGERAVAIKKAKDPGGSDYLVVSDESSRIPGRKISTRRTLQVVEAACVAAGQVATVKRKFPDKGTVVTQKALHCVHDLRHTYAVMTYHAEMKQGNREPWKKIQAQLGHKDMQTTIDTYLRYVSVFEL